MQYALAKPRVPHFFIFGAISSTTVTRKYTPYSNQVIVLFQGKLFSGWFNANIINTIAIINIITPIILDILFFMKSTSSSNLNFLMLLFYFTTTVWTIFFTIYRYNP